MIINKKWGYDKKEIISSNQLHIKLHLYHMFYKFKDLITL